MSRLLVVAGLFASLVSPVLIAQDHQMTANIPFDFQIGKASMPAGEYRIYFKSQTLTLRCQDLRHNAVILTIPQSRGTVKEKGTLRFNRYGETYFFSEVWLPGVSDGGSVMKSPREKDVARRMEAAGDQTAVALNTR